MTYVVTDNCIKCKYTDCVEQCPVDCFREGPTMLYIDPDLCIDCQICVPLCPAEAIFSEDGLPDIYAMYLQINKEQSKKCPEIVDKKDPLPTARTLDQILDYEKQNGPIQHD